MPSKFLKAEWFLYDSGEGSWTIETRHDDGRRSAIIAMRSPWPSKAAESLANGRLFLASQKMYRACETYLANREWELKAASSDGPNSQDTIRQFAERQRDLHEQVVAALAEADGPQTHESQPEGAA